MWKGGALYSAVHCRIVGIPDTDLNTNVGRSSAMPAAITVGLSSDDGERYDLSVKFRET